MRTLESIERYSTILLGRCLGCLKARRKTGPAPRIDTAARQRIGWPVERPDSGGYNEAYVMHHWASFNPRGR